MLSVSLINVKNEFEIPDTNISCIHGINKYNLTEINRNMKKRGFTNIVFNSREGDWEGIYSQIPFSRKGYIPFVKTLQNKGLTWAEIGGVVIVTSCYESGAGCMFRKAQIEEMKNVFKDRYIFIGDTQLPCFEKVDTPKFYDAWEECGTSKNQETNNGERYYRIWATHDIECNSFNTCRGGIVASFQITF